MPPAAPSPDATCRLLIINRLSGSGPRAASASQIRLSSARYKSSDDKLFSAIARRAYRFGESARAAAPGDARGPRSACAPELADALGTRRRKEPQRRIEVALSLSLSLSLVPTDARHFYPALALLAPRLTATERGVSAWCGVARTPVPRLRWALGCALAPCRFYFPTSAKTRTRLASFCFVGGQRNATQRNVRAQDEIRSCSLAGLAAAAWKRDVSARK